MAQSRLSETIARISAIELNNIKDTALANKKRKENDAALQRANMKQQKESEFLREMQLCKSRQMQRVRLFLFFFLFCSYLDYLHSIAHVFF